MINPVVFQGNAVDSQGNVLSGATISVISVTTGLPVLLYSDLADTEITNPFNTGPSGAFVFYCEAETVNVKATKGASSRTWENQFLNVVSLKNDLKTNPQTVSAPWTFEVPTYMQSPLNMSNGIPISFGSVSVLNGTYNSIPTLKVNNVELLTKNTLSNANNIVDTDRAVNNVGWWAIAQENLGTAAFADIGIGGGEVTANSEETDIFIVYGQSNTVGFAGQVGVPAVDNSATPSPSSRSKYYDPATNSILPMSNTMNHLNYVDEGTASRGNGWTAFANKWVDMTGRGAVIINAARGGKSIAELSKGAGAGATAYYQVLIDGLASAKLAMTAAGLTLGKVYVTWHQGETDMTLGTNNITYRNALNQLATDLFTDIPELEKFGIFIVGNPDSRDSSTWERIQKAQWEAVRYGSGSGYLQNMGVISDICPTFTEADGQYNPVDGTHYSQRGYNAMGESGAVGLYNWVIGSQKSGSPLDAENRVRLNGTAKQSMQLVQGQVTHNGTGWILKRLENTTAGAATYPCYVQRVDIAADGIVFVFAGKAPVTYNMHASCEFATIPNVQCRADFWNVGNEWGVKVFAFADLEFGVACDSAALFTGSPLTPTGGTGFINSIISASGATGARVTLTHPLLISPPRASYYASSAYEAGQVGSRPLTTTTTNISISGTSPVAMVSMSKVPITPAQLAQNTNITIKISGFVSDDL